MKKNIMIAGGTGMLGQALTARLIKSGFQVFILTRSEKSTRNKDIKYLHWNPKQNFQPDPLPDIYGIINLAGTGIADGRWTEKRKQKILSSRVDSALCLSNMINESGKNPEVYIGASAIGIYGNQGSRELKESDIVEESGFLVNVCKKWEQAHMEMEPLCNRLLIFRMGIVLSEKGGVLSKMTPPLYFGINPYFGSGDQIYSWIHIEDLCGWMLDCLENPDIMGVYNVVSPNPEKAKIFARKLSKGMGKRPILIPVPVWFLRIILGEMADTVLWSQNVSPEKLQKTGFEFKFPELEAAVQDLF